MKRTLNTIINRSKNAKNDEHITRPDNTINETEYVRGKDLSGALQGAGGVGGLLYLTANDTIYIPCYDNNGNITRYLDSTGNTVAQYTYDAFGNTISQSGPLADFFRHRFSTKYYDSESGLYYYGYRFYHPTLMRWLTRDPIGEAGGKNLYAFCNNNSIDGFDTLGATAVRINVGTEEKDSPRGILNFIKIDATIIEPPKNGGKLNFIQLRKSPYKDWELDIQGTPGPYYYKLFDVKNYTRKDAEGNDIVTLYDAPGGFLDKVDFFTAIVEVNRSCRAGKYRYGFPIIKCYDKVKVISSVSWSFDPRSSGYQYSGNSDNLIKRGSMIPTMQQLINLSAWNTELCPTTRVEVQNDKYGH